MARILISLICLSLLAGCSKTKFITSAANYLKENGEVKSVTTGNMVKTTAKLSNVWNGATIKKYCPEALITIDVAKGELTAVTNCNLDSLATLTGEAGKVAKILSGK